jgi:hypothetical protein
MGLVMKISIPTKLAACVVAAGVVLGSHAEAAVLQFTLENSTFDDGGTASGSFDYNTVTGAYTNIDITTTSGTVLTGNTYTSYSVNSFPRDYGFGSTVAGETADGDSLLDLNTTTDFTMPGTVSLGDPSGFISAEGYIDGVDYVPQRDLSGSAIGVVISVPEPATWSMMILGLGLAGTSLRRRSALAEA